MINGLMMTLLMKVMMRTTMTAVIRGNRADLVSERRVYDGEAVVGDETENLHHVANVLDGSQREHRVRHHL